jgi:asparagine synthase (glutamine-hydrolysing)
MPGIVGIISRKPAAECERAVKSMTAIMRHESFHTSGTFFAPESGVYAGWVAHENSFADGQVFQNETGDIALVFAGECFIDAATRNRLRQAGHSFSGGGDCLVHLYEQLGEGFFGELNGLFSGLLIDRRQGNAFLFNDRYAMERIYWHETGDAFYFASEAKALLRILPELREFDTEGVAELFSVNCTMGTRTLFRGIQRLPGGARWTFENGLCRRENYFSPSTWEALPKLPQDVYEKKLRETFLRIVPRYFESDTTVGVALTGGLDTRMIMACRPPEMRNQTCYTFTGPTGRTLDDRVAAQVAAACGLEHRLLRLNPDFFQSFAAKADKTVYITDGCSGTFGAHEIYFHQQARQLATMRLTGNYGSEVLRAITTFKPIGLKPEIFDAGFASEVNAAAGRWAAEKQHPDTFAAFKEIPWNLFGNLAAGRSQITFRTPYLDNEIVALSYQCPASIKKSSLPTMRLVKACSPALDRIPTDRGFISDRSGPDIFARRVFAEVTFKLDYHSNAGLPRKLGVLDPIYKPIVFGLGIAGLHKFLKYSTWFQQDLAPYVRDGVERTRGSSFLDSKFLGQIADLHIRGRTNYSAELNAILTLEAIERKLLRELPRGSND